MPQPSRVTPYLIHPVCDFLLLGGLSLLVFAVVKAAGFAHYSERAYQVSAVLMWFINWPHFSATLYRLFHRKENQQQFPATSYGIPWLILLGTLASFASPALVAPFFVKLFMIWSPYHFSGQTLGITLIYLRRNQITLAPWARLALAAFIFGTYATSTLRAETQLTGMSYYGIEYPGLGVPLWMPKLAEIIMYSGGLAFVFFAVDWSANQRRLFPWMALVPPVAQYVWFIAGSSLQPFNVFVPMFHSLQYLPVAWAMQLAERSSDVDRARFSPLWETSRWIVLNFIGGAVLFWGLPQFAALFSIPLAFATGITNSAVQIHHFFVDGVIWKLRNSRIASPLMGSVRDYFKTASSPSLKAAA